MQEQLSPEMVLEIVVSVAHVVHSTARSDSEYSQF